MQFNPTSEHQIFCDDKCLKYFLGQELKVTRDFDGDLDLSTVTTP